MFTVFENQGVIDARAIKTFGVSAKEKEDAIGYFGTGLKYAIAIILRNNMHVEMLSGGERFVFEKRDIEMRGKKFEIITMNDEELPFTTQLGKNWQTWQAFRELYCNCLDENGSVSSSDIVPLPEQGKTKFIVKGSEFTDSYFRRNEIVLGLPDSLKFLGGEVEIFDQPNKSLFYRGVRVYDFDKPTMFTYNIKEECQLTEDRTLQNIYAVVDKLPRALTRVNDASRIRRAITADDSYQERSFSYLTSAYFESSISLEFKEVLAQEFKDNNDNLNKSARDFHRKIINASASKHYQKLEMSDVENMKLRKAVSILERVFPDFSSYKLMVVHSLGNDTVALADRRERTMVISQKAFDQGTKYLVSTLLEEYTHLKTGFDDATRALQTHLFDTICSLIENHVTKEPM